MKKIYFIIIGLLIFLILFGCVKKDPEKYESGSWKCYDGSVGSKEYPQEIVTVDEVRSDAESFCKDKCNTDLTKCGVDCISVGLNCLLLPM